MPSRRHPIRTFLLGEHRQRGPDDEQRDGRDAYSSLHDRLPLVTPRSAPARAADAVPGLRTIGFLTATDGVQAQVDQNRQEARAGAATLGISYLEALVPEASAIPGAIERLAEQKVDAVIVSDYAKGFLTDHLISEIFRLARRAG